MVARYSEDQKTAEEDGEVLQKLRAKELIKDSKYGPPENIYIFTAFKIGVSDSKKMPK